MLGATAIFTGFTNGVGQIWLDDAACTGTETRLIDCSNPGLGVHNCDHTDDAGVTCTASVCTQGGIRLQGGTANSGRVEICNNNIWGTVCSDSWGTVDAQVACRQLGLPATGKSEISFLLILRLHILLGATAIFTGFTNGVGQIWLDDAACTGTETRLIDCSNPGLGVHNCDHTADAGVTCTASVCTQGGIRLQGGTTNSGRVEICNNNVWGTVCSDSWGTVDAQVACRQLGLPATGKSEISFYQF